MRCVNFFPRENGVFSSLGLQWFNRFKKWLDEKENSGKAVYRTVSADESAKIIKNNSTSFNGKVDEADAKRWGLGQGNKVAVLPSDEGKCLLPTNAAIR
jgi:hypothetical protein